MALLFSTMSSWMRARFFPTQQLSLQLLDHPPTSRSWKSIHSPREAGEVQVPSTGNVASFLTGEFLEWNIVVATWSLMSA